MVNYFTANLSFNCSPSSSHMAECCCSTSSSHIAELPIGKAFSLIIATVAIAAALEVETTKPEKVEGVFAEDFLIN